MQLKLQATQFLKSTGIIDAYEHVIEQLIMNGWPSDKPMYDHVSYEILKFHADHKDEYAQKRLQNPGPTSFLTPREG